MEYCFLIHLFIVDDVWEGNGEERGAADEEKTRWKKVIRLEELKRWLVAFDSFIVGVCKEEGERKEV